MKQQKEWSNKVQLRLRMTSEQINEQNKRDKERASNMGSKDMGRTTRLFNSQAQSPWGKVVRSKPPYNSKGEFHYRYHAQLARDIAQKKDNTNARRYWNKQASRLEEKADGFELARG